MIEAILGIDVSKKDLSVTLFSKETFKSRKISNDFDGFKELTNLLKKQDLTHVMTYLEATGKYGEGISN